MINLVAELVFCCLGGVSNKFHWGQVGWECSSSLSYPWWFSFFFFVLILILWWFSIFVFSHLLRSGFWNSKLQFWIFTFLLSILSVFCFIYFEALLLHAYIFFLDWYFFLMNSSLTYYSSPSNYYVTLCSERTL